MANPSRLQVRHDDHVHDAEDYTCGEQDEFDGHATQYTFSRVHVCCRSSASRSQQCIQTSLRLRDISH
jgi:hypothetical protein